MVTNNNFQTSQGFQTSRLARAVGLALISGSVAMGSYAQESERDPNQEIEEVVVEGSRLQGTAQAVLEERKNQAFVADILGSEQISRTGDGDAASALRRVTGLTLVDGKFIYVRGLGERYSSTQLNGSSVPSPDPTRAVIPLDLFPSSIISSLNVQKSFSPELPAHFGGGNVDIRTKSIPEERILNIKGDFGLNSSNSGSSLFYSGGGSRDEFGVDDGTRELPTALRNALGTTGIDTLSADDSKNLLSSLNRDISSQAQSIDPDYGFGFAWGDGMDVADESRLGFLATVGYKKSWLASNERNVNQLVRAGDGSIRINEFEDGSSTENKVRLSSMVNFGFEYDQNHRFELNNIFLRDTRDRLRDRVSESTNTIDEPLEENRKVDIVYEERQLFTQQLKGTHNFPEWFNIGADWYYSNSTAERNAPGGFEANFRVDFQDDGNGNPINPTQRLASNNPATYFFQELKDKSENWGFNVSLPIFADDYSIEFKGGMDIFQKERNAENIDIGIQGFLIAPNLLVGDDYRQAFSDAAIAQQDFIVRFSDNTSDGDKYSAATTIDAFYFMADMELGNAWRLTGGVRYEEFRQISIPFQPHSDRFDVEFSDIADLIFEEFELFPSLAATYIVDAESQWRFNYSQTAIRPDLRDISTSFYIDPLTEFLVRGSTSLQSSKLDNYDVRWEYYAETGETLSVAVFYKDIQNPIEQIELPSATEGAPQLLTANAESGELFGVEVEFLKDFSFLDDEWANYFVTGNVTLSDSEVDIGLDGNPTTISLFERQLQEALNTTGAVTEVITNNKRRLIGHSEWVFNVQFGWDSLDNNHSASLVYNVFGPRIIIPGANGFDDGEEQPFHSVDFVYTFYPTFDSTLKVSLKNIFDEEKEIEQEGVTLLREDVGTQLSVSYSLDF